MISRYITLWDIMKHFNGLGFATLFAAMQRVETAASILPIGSVDDDLAITNLSDMFSEVEASCDELGLPVAAQKAKASRVRVQSGTLNSIGVGVECNGLAEIISYELATYICMYIEPTRAPLYSESNLFGQEVADKFPSSSFDIEEAGKCLALNRATASVFHLMRVLEAGLYALVAALGVQDIEPNWHNAIEQAEKQIRALPTKTSQEKTDSAFYSDALAYLFNVKEPWRNRSAHSGHTYTEEKAQQIYDSVGAFMQVLSARLTEQSL